MEYLEIDIAPFVIERPWVCPRCKAAQLPSEVRTTEIIEPGKSPRVEFYGKIRPDHTRSVAVYSCLVCGHTWIGSPYPPDPEDPTPGGASVTFLHPITEEGFDGVRGHELFDRDAC